MLEDVNNILNSGDVPNLYGPEEMDRIMTACRPICAKKRIPATKLNVFAQVGMFRRHTTVRYFLRGALEFESVLAGRIFTRSLLKSIPSRPLSYFYPTNSTSTA